MLRMGAFAQGLNIDHKKNMHYDANRRIQVIDFGVLEQADSLSMPIFYSADGQVEITSITMNGDFSLRGASRFKAKKRGEIPIVFRAENRDVGKYQGTAEIRSTGKRNVRVIGFKVEVIRRFSDAPAVEVEK